MPLPFVEENAASRRRLQALAARLTDQDLARTTHYGWTIYALLAHQAFWDQRVLELIRRWKANGFDASPIDSTAINGALKPLCHALDPQTAVELCLESARQVDAELESVSAKLYEDIQSLAAATSTQFRFIRALHRNDHLNDIEALLEPR